MNLFGWQIPIWVLDWSGSLLVVISIVFLFRKRIGYWHWSNASLVPYFLLFVSTSQLMLAGLQASYLIFGVHGLLLWKLEDRRDRAGHRFNERGWYHAGWILSLAIFGYTVAATQFVDGWAWFQFWVVSLSLLANWATTRKWTWSWPVWLLVNALQAVYFDHLALWGLFLVQFVLFAMSVRGWVLWHHDDRARSSSMPPFEHALVVGKFAPFHRGHQLVLDTATRIAAQCTVIVWSNPDFPAMPTPVRAAWIAELYPDAMVVVGEAGPPNDAPDADHHAYIARLLDARGLQPDVVLTSERYGPGFAASLGAAHECVDVERTAVPISGDVIRSDVHDLRQWLDPRVYRHFVERVVFLGAEGTGKSTLAEHLAAELGTAFVPEYGRDHYAERGGHLDLDDYVAIVLRHRELEDEAVLRANRYLFVDTNAITTMFFSHYYNRDSRPALRLLANECAARYQHVIVCDDDIPFEQDGWRDNETWRARMQGMVLHDLAVRGIEHTVVRGSLEQRVDRVRAALANGPPHSAEHARVSLGPRPTPPR